MQSDNLWHYNSRILSRKEQKMTQRAGLDITHW